VRAADAAVSQSSKPEALHRRSQQPHCIIESVACRLQLLGMDLLSPQRSRGAVTVLLQSIAIAAEQIYVRAKTPPPAPRDRNRTQSTVAIILLCQ